MRDFHQGFADTSLRCGFAPWSVKSWGPAHDEPLDADETAAEGFATVLLREECVWINARRQKDGIDDVNDTVIRKDIRLHDLGVVDLHTVRG